MEEHQWQHEVKSARRNYLLIIAKVLQSHELRPTSKVELCLLQTDPLTTDLQLMSTTEDQVAGSDLEVE